jgi:hypothetical protein
MSILDVRRPIWSLRQEILEMTALFAESGAITNDTLANLPAGETRTTHGLAISPKMAAMCAADFVRTVQFLRGTRAAINDVRARYPERPARVLYIGCGPYATLAVALMAVLAPSEACFTMLDVHPESIASVRSIIGALALADRVARYEAMDANSYRVDPGQPPDIILLETMQACLEVEPQVAITRHLSPQAPQAILIPQDVRIDLVWVDVSREFNFSGKDEAEAAPRRDRVPVGTVFRLNRDTVSVWESISGNRLPGLEAALLESIDRRYQPMLFTIIRIYRDHVLQDYDSGLTTPRVFSTVVPLKPGTAIQFQYELGPHPRLVGVATTQPPEDAEKAFLGREMG